MFHIVASTESNHLKLLMIIGDVKQTVTYMEFEKKYIFGKQGFFFFFFFIVERYMQTTDEIWNSKKYLTGARKNLVYAGVKCTQDRNVIWWRCGFCSRWTVLLCTASGLLFPSTLRSITEAPTRGVLYKKLFLKLL